MRYTYSRDVDGRIKTIAPRFVGGPTSVDAFPNSYAYFPASGKIQSFENADGLHAVTYDPRGLVATITAPEGTYRYDGYDAMGRNTSLTYPDGHQRIQQFDAEGRISSRCYRYSNDPNPHCYTATYDPAGNPATMSDPTGHDLAEYDAINRVIRVTHTPKTAGNDQVETYDYNTLGAIRTNAGVNLDDQRPKLSGGGSADAAIPNTYPAGDAPVAVDLQGKITALAGVTVSYDKRGRITSVNGPNGSDSYQYDAYSRRITDKNAVLLYEGANLVATIESGKVTQSWFFDGVDHPLRRRDQNGAIQYYELDLAGNVRWLRGPNGTDLGGYRYTAFGKAIANDPTISTLQITQPLQWKGRWHLDFGGEVEFYDMRARWWAPQLGTFMTVDAFTYADGRTTLWGWPGQNPMVWSDQTGHDGTVAALGSWLFGGSAASATGGAGITVGEFLPPVLIATVAAAATVGGMNVIDSIADNAAQQQRDAAMSWVAAHAAANTIILEQRGNEKQQIKEAARQLGVGAREVGKAIERIKKASGRGGAQNVEIDPVTGDVVGDGEWIGNIIDEVGECRGSE